MAFDLVIRNGWIVDGTGFPKFFGDVAVKDGKIAEVGIVDNAGRARRAIDAGGLTVAPGFIDPHPFRRAGHLGSDSRIFVLARHHDSNHGQLRLRARTVPAARPRATS
jgi:imidazolonepropionase-like amidohydrolase